MSETPDAVDTPIWQPAVDALQAGGVIAYPTEAVFGLGCDPRNEQALQRIIDVKGRDSHKGFILIAQTQSQLTPYLADISLEQQQQLEKHWPGPVTFVAKADPAIRNSILTGYRDTLAVRVTAHPLVRDLCQRYGGAIVSTSANRSGEASLRCASDVKASMGAELDCIIDAPVGDAQASPSRIFDLATGEQLR